MATNFLIIQRYKLFFIVPNLLMNGYKINKLVTALKLLFMFKSVSVYLTNLRTRLTYSLKKFMKWLKQNVNLENSTKIVQLTYYFWRMFNKRAV